MTKEQIKLIIAELDNDITVMLAEIDELHARVFSIQTQIDDITQIRENFVNQL